MKSIWTRVADAIINASMKRPWLHIKAGEYTTTDPVDGSYMERYWFFNPYEEVVWIDPNDPKRFGTKWHETNLPSIRCHRIKQSDSDRACHNHPWWFITIILRGGYFEVRPIFGADGLVVKGYKTTWHGPGSVLFRRPSDYHRIIVPEGGEAWTLFTTGKKVQTWSFLVEGFARTWRAVPYKEYLNRG